ncbi:MAG: dienelactone hydrolase family protein [Steroidobacteraceae bacterium]
MPYVTHETDSAVTLEPARAAIATVILMHGLGADGYDFVPIVEELRLTDAVRFIFPHARTRPVTINNGYVMRAWYDIKSLDGVRVEDDAGIRESSGLVEQLIASEISKGIAAERIVLAGFSQGGAIALHAGLRHAARLAGILALSTYLPLLKSVAAEASAANRKIPILMCHGLQDQVIAPAMARASRDALTALGYTVDWREYPMPHSVCAQEIADIAAWLRVVLA